MRDSIFRYGCCQAAAVTVDITPVENMYHRMWGAALHDQAVGIHQPLEANLLLLQSSTGAQGESVLVVSLDHCLFWKRDLDSIKSIVVETTGFADDQIVVFFTHTHAAGLMDTTRGSLPGGDLIAPYLAEVADRLAVAATGLQERLCDVWLTGATGACSLAANRDLWDSKRQQFVCGYNPEGDADPTVMTIRITDLQGELIAVLVNYACHPTTLAWDNQLISPDYVGGMRQTLRHALGDIPIPFIQGASGDVGPREGFVGDVGVAEKNGRQLGLATLESLAAMPEEPAEFSYDGPVLSGATIGTWSYKPFTADRLKQFHNYRKVAGETKLPYREDLGTLEQTEADLDRLLEESEVEGQTTAQRRDQRALIERLQRKRTRFSDLTDASGYPYSIRGWQFGEIGLLAFNGEMYNILQTNLRSAFPDQALIVGTLADGSQCWYLPQSSSYGQGLYQEDASVIARGGLEQLCDATIELFKEG